MTLNNLLLDMIFFLWYLHEAQRLKTLKSKIILQIYFLPLFIKALEAFIM